MALTQLLRPKQKFHVHKMGLPRPRRWSSSSSSGGEGEQSSQRKQLEAAEGRDRPVAGASDMQKFVGMDPGILPTQTQVSGTFGSVRSMLTQMKEKVLGHFQLQNHSTSLMSDSRVDTAVPGIAPRSCPDNAEVGPVKGIVQSSEALRNSLSCVKNISKNETPHMMVENPSDYMVNATSSEATKIPDNQKNTEFGDPGSLLKCSETKEDSLGTDKKFLVPAAPLEIEKHSSEDVVGITASEVSKMDNNLDRSGAGENMISKHSKASRMYNYLDRSEVGETLTTVQLPEVSVDPYSNKKNVSASDQRKKKKKNVSTSVMSHMMGENPSADIAQSEKTRDTSKLVGPGSGSIQNSVVAGIAAAFNKDLMSKSQKRPFINEDTSRALPKDGLEELTANRNENCEHNEKIISSGQPSSADTEDDENLAPTGSAQVMGLSDMFARKMNTPAPGEMASQEGLALTPTRFSEDSNKTSGEDVSESSDIGSLLDFLKVLPNDQPTSRSPDNKSSQTNKVGYRGLPMKEKEGRGKDPVRRIQSCSDLQRSGSKGGATQLKTIFVDNKIRSINNTKKKLRLNTLFEEHEENTKSDEDEEAQCLETPFKICQENMSDDANRCHSEFEAIDHASELYAIAPCPTGQDPNKNLNASSNGEESKENKVLMRFLLKSTPKREIHSALKDCGPIAKISEFCSVKGSNFKDAYVYFKTSSGLSKALKKTDLVVEDVDVIIEGPSSLEINSYRISIPDLIGDPDVPRALVKNPIRTAMIKGLTLDMSWKHLEEALSPWKGIAGFIMGSSSSVAYVEFETEDDKEKAIAKNSFQVLGKYLQILRIDAPRTTVARISNVNTEKGKKKIFSVCSQYGQVKSVVHRDVDTMDVHFKLEEWPNMLHILNSLNGKIVDDSQWVARPATVYPPDILRALWSQPDGREHVKSIISNLLQKIGKSNNTDVERLTNVAAKYYGG